VARRFDAPARAGKPIWSRPTQSAYSRRPLRIGSPACALEPRLDDFLRIAPKNRRTLSYHILREKRNSRMRREK
jgi:hypothetical protein